MYLPGGGGGTPGNSWWGCTARFFKSWPDFRPRNVIFHTRFQTRPLKPIHVFRPGLKAEIMLSLLRLERKQKNYSNVFRIRIFLLLSYSFGIETLNAFIYSVVPSKTISGSRPKVQSVYPFSDQNGAKTLPDGAAHTYMASIREYPTPGYVPWTLDEMQSRKRHMWVEFVVGFLPCSERFYSGYSGFPLSSKTNTSKFQFRSGTHGHV